MNRFDRFLMATFLSAAMPLPNMLQAMTFPQFDHMAKQDRQDFLDSLLRDAETVLKQEGRSADAQKVHHLFNDIAPGSNLPLGEAELELNLDNARVRAAKKVFENPDAPPVQVEAALALTLSKHGVEITPDFVRVFMKLTGIFQPQSPPLRVSVAQAISQAQEIREEKRGVIKDAMGDGEKRVERDLGTEDDEYRISDAILSAAMPLPGSAQAMTFPQFDALANQDRQDFLDSLSRDAETVLKQEGRSADAQKVHHLFNDIAPGSNLPLGEAELELNLDNARVADAERVAIQYPNLPRILVEAAMAVTLKNNGIELSPDRLKDFERLASTFKPKLPPNEAGVKAAELAVSQVLRPAPAVTAPRPVAAPAPPPDSPVDDPMKGDGGFIIPPKAITSEMKVDVCVPPDLVDKLSWDNPVPDSEMAAFKTFLKSFVRSYADGRTLYRITDDAFDRFDRGRRASTPYAPDPSIVFRAVPVGQKCPVTNYVYTVAVPAGN